MGKRPTPQWIAARKWEIRRRYDKRFKVGRRSRGMAAIRLAELTRWLNDALKPAKQLDPLLPSSETILRVFAHHFAHMPDAPRRINAWVDRYAPWLTARELEILIGEAVSCPLKYSADKLAWKIRLTDAKRTELKIRTIGAIDCTAAQRKERRKAKRKQRDAARHAAKRCSPNIYT